MITLSLIDWFGRFLILAWALFLVCQWRHDRRSRPDPALVARLADEAERRHGAKASWILGAQWNTYRLERAERARTETRRGYILRAVAKELALRHSGCGAAHPRGAGGFHSAFRSEVPHRHCERSEAIQGRTMS